jgi:ATP-dependent Clp protease protease subunit|tara:strand:+ start:2485 stop:3117 length:633 start_codon:yes stop_codon:yes gene_type:complete
MINRILDRIAGGKKVSDKEKKLLESELEKLLASPPQPDLRVIGLFSDVSDDKIAELIHALIYLDEINRITDENRPVEFYISTYGGSADDMFGMYDIMRVIRERTPIQTIGLGKVMSAGVLLLAAGTKGKRCIGKNCRVMVHSVIGGSHGPLHNLINEMDAIEQIQKMYSDALIAETNLTKKDLKKLLEKKVNVYLSAEEAVELGIADIIV